MNLRTLLRTAGVSAALAALVLSASTASADDPIGVKGLGAPRGITGNGETVLVAEQAKGRILSLSADGKYKVVVSGLPTDTFIGPEGETTAGVTAAIVVDGTYYWTMGESEKEGFQSVWMQKGTAKPVLVADLGAYEEKNNTDGGTNPDGSRDTVSNPYDLVSDGEGGLLVSDSGANAILHIDAEGVITPYAVFKDRTNPRFGQPGGPSGGPTMDQVPTGLTWGRDGALYVSTLTGFPFPSGGARIYRMADYSGNGNVMDQGETTVYAEGLSVATSLAFTKDGTLLVTEFSTSFLAQAPGRVVRVEAGKVAGVVAEGIVSPTGIGILTDEDGHEHILVSSEFTGQIVEVGHKH